MIFLSTVFLQANLYHKLNNDGHNGQQWFHIFYKYT